MQQRNRRITITPLAEKTKRPNPHSLFAIPTTTRYYFLAGDAETYINCKINPNAGALLALIGDLFTRIGTPRGALLNSELIAFNLAKLRYPQHSLTILELKFTLDMLLTEQVYFNFEDALVNIKSFSFIDTYDKGKIIPFDREKLFPRKKNNDISSIPPWRF